MFETVPLSAGYFVGTNRLTCAAPFGTSDSPIRGGPCNLCRLTATVNCVRFLTDNGNRMVYGTENGVYLADLRDKTKVPVKVISVPSVTQLDILEEQGILIVLAGARDLSLSLCLSAHSPRAMLMIPSGPVRHPRRQSGANVFRRPSRSRRCGRRREASSQDLGPRDVLQSGPMPRANSRVRRQVWQRLVDDQDARTDRPGTRQEAARDPQVPPGKQRELARVQGWWEFPPFSMDIASSDTDEDCVTCRSSTSRPNLHPSTSSNRNFASAARKASRLSTSRRSTLKASSIRPTRRSTLCRSAKTQSQSRYIESTENSSSVTTVSLALSIHSAAPPHVQLTPSRRPSRIRLLRQQERVARKVELDHPVGRVPDHVWCANRLSLSLSLAVDSRETDNPVSLFLVSCAALHYPYVLAFEPTFIEVRHVESGALMQIIPGNNIRCLFADNPPSASSSSSSASPYYANNSRYGSPYGQHPSRFPSPAVRNDSQFSFFFSFFSFFVTRSFALACTVC